MPNAGVQPYRSQTLVMLNWMLKMQRFKKNFLAGEIINYMDICCLVAFKFGFSVFTTPNIEWPGSCVKCAICRRESRYICLIYVSKGKGVLQDWASNGAHGNTN